MQKKQVRIPVIRVKIIKFSFKIGKNIIHWQKDQCNLKSHFEADEWHNQFIFKTFHEQMQNYGKLNIYICLTFIETEQYIEKLCSIAKINE